MMHYPDSELLINPDGSIFHLHLKPEQLADTVLLVGDPGRVLMISSFFDTIECQVENREFVTITGCYKGKRISVVGTGIGTDNIDIVLNELDALVNIDLTTRLEKEVKKSLTIIRIGTCGGLQPDLPVGTFLVSEKSIATDGMLYFYEGFEKINDAMFQMEFEAQTVWPDYFNVPLVVNSDIELVNKIAGKTMKRGVTISANGFYGPQGRRLRIPLKIPDLVAKIEEFSTENYKITNFEMESSAVAGLSALLGHKAMTVCLVIANRKAKKADVDYQDAMKKLVSTVLERL